MDGLVPWRARCLIIAAKPPRIASPTERPIHLQRSFCAASKIDSELDGVGNCDMHVDNLKTAERKRFERKCVALQFLEERSKRATGERAEFAVAFAFELVNFGLEFVADVELGVDVNVGAGKKFLRLDPDLSGK